MPISRPNRTNGDIVFVTHDEPDRADTEPTDAVTVSEAAIETYEMVDTSDLAFDVIDLSREDEVTTDELDIKMIPACNDPEGADVEDDGNLFHVESDGIRVALFYRRDPERHATDFGTRRPTGEFGAILVVAATLRTMPTRIFRLRDATAIISSRTNHVK